MSAGLRDPRIDPMPGDVLRKWGHNYTIVTSAMGWVTTVDMGLGILFFRQWAADAEVIHVDPAMPPVQVAVPEHCND
jgi:hypothetical protein